VSTTALRTLFPASETTVERAPAPSPNGSSGVVDLTDEDSFLVRLDRMSSNQRLRAYRSGSFSRAERARWACRYPDEVPTVNGEIEWIALSSADLD
jgi:hypothetical protein